MKDDLISRKAILDEAKRLSGPITGDGWDNWGVYGLIERQPPVSAVPLDKLCLLLHDIAGAPCYTQRGQDKCNQLIGDSCNPEWSDEECWKQFLTKWMEENK